MDIFEQMAEIRLDEAVVKTKAALTAARKLGRAEGRQEADEDVVKAFLSSTEFSVEKIAGLLDVSVAFVSKVKEGLGMKSKVK